MAKEHPRLTTEQKNQICSILSIGATRAMAAQYAGCHHATLRAEIRRDRDFAQRVIHSELKLESVCLKSIREAASDPKQWRAAAWALERVFPNRYARRKASTITTDQANELVAEFNEIIASELPVPKFRKRIFDRLALVYTNIQINTAPQRETDHTHAQLMEPSNELPRLVGPPHLEVGLDTPVLEATSSTPPSEPTETQNH
jgi:hypothetical protein